MTNPAARKRGNTSQTSFKGLLIFREGWNTPWSKKIFLSEEYAKAYFDSYCTQHNFDFDWAEYVLVTCRITYSLPAPITKPAKRKK